VSYSRAGAGSSLPRARDHALRWGTRTRKGETYAMNGCHPARNARDFGLNASWIRPRRLSPAISNSRRTAAFMADGVGASSFCRCLSRRCCSFSYAAAARRSAFSSTFCSLAGLAFSGFALLGRWGASSDAALGSSECSPPHNYAGLRHRRCNDFTVFRLLRKALMEKIAARAPGFERGLHRRRCDGEIVKALRGLICLKLPWHV
jgi:hypothetical protein